MRIVNIQIKLQDIGGCRRMIENILYMVKNKISR